MALSSLTAHLAKGGFDSLTENLKSKKLEKKFNSGIIDFEDMSWLGGYYFKKKDFIKAEFFAKKCLEIQPDNSSLKNSLFEIYYFSNNFSKAVEIIEALIMDGKDLQIHYFNLGYCYFKMGNQEKANEYRNQAIAIDSSFENQRYK